MPRAAKPFLVPKACSDEDKQNNVKTNPDGCYFTSQFMMTEWGKGFKPVEGPDGRTYLLPDSAFEIGQFAAAKKKQEAWIVNLQSLLSLAGIVSPQDGGKPDAVGTSTKNLYGIGSMKKVPIPSDVWVQAGRVSADIASAQSQAGELGAEWIETFEPLSSEVKIANESRYRFDFSVGLPVKKIDELQYSGTGGVSAKDVAAESILGLFNVVLWKKGIDLDNPKSFPYPRLLVGLGLKGRVLERPFVGLGIGLGWGRLSRVPIVRDLQPYAGLQRTITQVSTEAAAAGILPSAAWKLAIGINVPVKSIAERLSKKEKK